MVFFFFLGWKNPKVSSCQRVVLYMFYFVYCKNLQIAKSSDGFQITLDLGVKSQHHLNALFVDGGYSGIAVWIALGISTFPTL